MGVIICNSVISIIQEIKAKRTIEKLSLLTAPTTKVIRGGNEYEVTTEEVVIDDIEYKSNLLAMNDVQQQPNYWIFIVGFVICRTT